MAKGSLVFFAVFSRKHLFKFENMLKMRYVKKVVESDKNYKDNSKSFAVLLGVGL